MAEWVGGWVGGWQSVGVGVRMMKVLYNMNNQERTMTEFHTGYFAKGSLWDDKQKHIK